MPHPKYTVFAGVNGSGKSTLYKTGIAFDAGERINIDDIARDINEQYSIFPNKAGRIALEKIMACLDGRLSFSEPTTPKCCAL